MSVFVDTSVWSLALRRDQPKRVEEVKRLYTLLEEGELVFTTGLVLQELLQGFKGPKQRDLIIEKFAALASITPERQDYVEAASLHNECRRKGIQIGTIDALLAQLCLARQLQMLTSDQDFYLISRCFPLQLLV